MAFAVVLPCTSLHLLLVCRSAYYHLFRIAKIRASLTVVACKTLVHALVISRVDYGNALLYGITDRLLHRIEMIQHSAARIIMCIKRHDRQSITAVLQHLHWLPVKWRIHYKIVVLVFRALHGLAPAYVTTLITPYEPRRALRSAGTALLCVPRHLRRSFSCAGPALWRALALASCIAWHYLVLHCIFFFFRLFPIRGRHSGFSFSSWFYQLYLPPSLQPQPCPLSPHP